MSDLTKIAAQAQPARRRSKLEPYLNDLRRLQQQGYSLEQLKEFLGQIGVVVSRQTIYDFLKRREAMDTEPLAPGEPEKASPVVDSPAVSQPAPKAKTSGKRDAKQATPEQLRAITRGNINPSDFMDDE